MTGQILPVASRLSSSEDHPNPDKYTMDTVGMQDLLQDMAIACISLPKRKGLLRWPGGSMSESFVKRDYIINVIIKDAEDLYKKYDAWTIADRRILFILRQCGL